MGLSRQRARIQAAQEDQSTQASAENAVENNVAELSTHRDHDPPSDTNKYNTALNLQNKKSWYGTWPRKSTTSTQVAKETILADKPHNTALINSSLSVTKPITAPVKRPPSLFLGKGKGTSNITPLEQFTDESPKGKATNPRDSLVNNDINLPKGLDPGSSTVAVIEKAFSSTTEKGSTQQPTTSSGWLGWLSKPETQDITPIVPTTALDVVSKPPLPKNGEGYQGGVPREDFSTTVPVVNTQEPTPVASTSISWLGSWLIAPTSGSGIIQKEQFPSPDLPAVRVSETNKGPSTGPSWAFWSTDSKKAIVESEDLKEVGQLAVTGQPSQNHPQPAEATSKNIPTTNHNKKSRFESIESEVIPKTATSSSTASEILSNNSLSAKPSSPNLLLPSVKSTYRLVGNPSLLEQLSRLLRRENQISVKHVNLVKDQPKIKKAVAIGIHGLFPAPLLRTVIGQPTGTSIKFANHAAIAIRRWADKNGSTGCEIEKIALEGEGRINERVETLWKLLLNWIDHIRRADFVLVACHSQGVPVGLMLVAKLIEFGVISQSRVGVCAMAGVSLGPFSDYKSRLISGSAGELFEFADPSSTVSQKYEDSLRVALKYGVRVTYCGSIDDQLISMESAIFAPAAHPYIYRAVFVDGRIHAPDFIAHLVGFALKLRNLGISDHGLIRELSAPLAGSLYTGEGHSRLYDDEKVYDLAIEFALESTSVNGVSLQLTKYELPTSSNPYLLPWIMRGLLEENFVKKELDSETTELLKQFDDWKPATKMLKDVKYRLEAVRSKL